MGFDSPSRDDAQVHDLAAQADVDLGPREAQHVGVAQPVRGREPRAVAGDARSRRRLHEDLAAFEAEPRERARRGRDRDRRARPSDRHREVGGGEAALASLVENAQARHRASSQRSDTLGPGAPGVTLNWRRTSR